MATTSSALRNRVLTGVGFFMVRRGQEEVTGSVTTGHVNINRQQDVFFLKNIAFGQKQLP
jgi:hypothetical protein